MKARTLVKIRRKAKYVFDTVGTERIRRNLLQAFPFWVASLLAGLVAVGYQDSLVIQKICSEKY